ncbi:DUF6274 family protein [Streptomyces sp. NPDC058231]|uniref:DUF6274 family protein n=1 Tax=Streptomyces sp. NPDC058231 TaxID=3346392 RepID=UPI0036EED373
MAASTARHETRALLRAHLAAASGYRHLTRHCPICHRLLRLAMEPVTASAPIPPPEPPALSGGASVAVQGSVATDTPSRTRSTAPKARDGQGRERRAEDGSPATT